MRFVLVFGIAISFFSSRAQVTDSLLGELSKTIAQKDKFIREKLDRIGRYKKAMAAKPGDFAALLRVYSEYKTFIYDSAFTYAQQVQRQAYQSHDAVKIAYAKLKVSFVLLSSGMYKESLDTLTTVHAAILPDSMKIEYHSLVARAYYDLVDFNGHTYYSPLYNKLGNQEMDSALLLCKNDPKLYLTMRALRNLKTENLEGARSDFEELMAKYKLHDPEMAIASSTLSYVYTKLGKTDRVVDLLAQAAIADLRSSTTETVAILNLSEILYKRGDITRAYQYVKEAMEAANFYGARHRKIQVAAIFPVIEGAELNNVNAQRRAFILYSVVVTLLSFLVIAFAVVVYKQFRKLKLAEKTISEKNEHLLEINERLREADKIKEEYIGYYFNINTEYLGKIEAFKKAIDLKLMTKKIDDIKFIVNNINLKKEREELYFSFDKVFLKLFPDFVTTFNSYFNPEDRIELKEDQLLTTELRIFALIRMGIHDSEKIAKVLDYSINTIYSYKARVKSKSIVPNDEFEKKIMEIQSV